MKEKAKRRDPDHSKLAKGRLMSKPGCLALSNYITLSWRLKSCCLHLPALWWTGGPLASLMSPLLSANVLIGRQKKIITVMMVINGQPQCLCVQEEAKEGVRNNSMNFFIAPFSFIDYFIFLETFWQCKYIITHAIKQTEIKCVGHAVG